jgi:hypothetical protein
MRSVALLTVNLEVAKLSDRQRPKGVKGIIGQVALSQSKGFAQVSTFCYCIYFMYDFLLPQHAHNCISPWVSRRIVGMEMRIEWERAAKPHNQQLSKEGEFPRGSG